MAASARDRWFEVVVPVLVGANALKTVLGLRPAIDVGLDDETIYLDAAHHLRDHFLPIAESSALYPRWYRLLSWFEPDPLALYLLNWSVLATVLPLLAYALARRAGAAIVPAAVVAASWAVSSSLTAWPYVSMFAALVLGLGALAASFVADRTLRLAIASVTLAAAAFVRPEIAAPAVLSVLLVIASAVRQRDRRAGLALGLTVGGPAALAFALGGANPFAHRREFFAFGQHYALNVVESQHLDVDPWYEWEAIARAAFPRAESVGAALLENPARFAWHVGRNLLRSPLPFVDLLGPLQHLRLAVQAPVALALGGVIALGLWRLPAILRGGRQEAAARLAPVLAGASLAAALAIGAIHPRIHYALPAAFLALPILAGAARARLLEAGRAPVLLVAALVALLVVAPPHAPGATPSLLAPGGRPPSSLETRATILALRRLGVRGRAVVLESDYARGVYALEDWERVAQWDKRRDEPFWDFVHARRINLVVLNARLRHDSRFASDPAFVAFDKGPSSDGGAAEDFRFVPVEHTSVVLAVRASLARAPATGTPLAP